MRYPDGVVVGNRVGLCVAHHDQVTGEIGGYRAKIVWESGMYWWWQGGLPLGWKILGALQPGPPVFGLNGDPEDHSHDALPVGEQCPTCGHINLRERDHAKPGKLRPTKTWTVTVPDDAEVGADLLDDWVDDFAIVFGLDHYTSRLKRYHVLMLLRAVTLESRHEIIAMVAEAAGRRLGR